MPIGSFGLAPRGVPIGNLPGGRLGVVFVLIVNPLLRDEDRTGYRWLLVRHWGSDWKTQSRSRRLRAQNVTGFARFQTARYQTKRGLSPPAGPRNGAPYFFGASAFAIAAGFAANAADGACAAAAGAEIAAAFAAASFAFASISAPFGAS